MKDFLAISEDFYSVQGEGVTTGVPSYFIRLMNCNLNCGISKDTLKKVRELAKNQETIPILEIEGNATWVCDSIPVWVQGHKKPFEYLYTQWEEQGILKAIRDHIVHLIWTGGEPTMKVNQECIVEFLKWFSTKTLTLPYSEIETNGTCYIDDELFTRINQINCSVKLSNSGHSKSERIIPFVLNRILGHENFWFKFVISSEEDIKEMFIDFIEPFSIPLQRVICMPALSKQEDYFERTKFIMEMAKKYKFIGMSRQHIAAWNQTVGV